jgi:hypothetical protein
LEGEASRWALSTPTSHDGTVALPGGGVVVGGLAFRADEDVPDLLLAGFR